MTSTSIRDIEIDVNSIDPDQAATLYKVHGCLVVRGLMRRYAEQIRQDIMASVGTAVELLKAEKGVRTNEGLTTPDGTLFIPAPKGFSRDWQVMVTSCRYTSSAAFLRSALDPDLLEIVGAILGPDVELFLNGQCLVKEPAGGHPKHLHQDAAYFEHRFQGPVAVLSYAVPTTINRGALHVVPGSHTLEVLDHVDTESHLGLDPATWTLDKAVPIEGEAGDAIFFHVKTIHGSPPNYSDEARPVFIHRYRQANDYVIVDATTATNREEAERRAAEARKENQHGFMVLGRRRFGDYK